MAGVANIVQNLKLDSGFLGARGQNVQLHFMQTMDGNFVPESVVYLVMKVSIQESVQEIKWSSGYAQNVFRISQKNIYQL
uniref:Uncharacterized protein n=1 Tax=Schistosoma haematobium TaxID=6185 RepID=A0A095BWI7_SCHHA